MTLAKLVKKGKRGQSTGSGPVTLIIILILLITLYIVMLPSEERAELLGEDDEDTGISEIVDENLTLFEEQPGRLDYRGLKRYEHDIDSFTLYRTTESAELKTENPFHIKNGWFDKKTKAIRLSLDDIDNINNVILTFTATRYKGILIIRFNGDVVFESQFTRTYVEPVRIDNSLIREDNIIEFEVADVGWAFWTTNEYMIEGFKVIGDITDISKQQSRNVFVVSSIEKENLDEVKLKFNPNCMPNDAGLLDVFINNNRIFSGVPDCGILNTKEFSVGYIDEGENILVFKTNQGSYIIDHIKVVTELKDVIYPFYYFDINKSVFKELEDGALDIELTMLFFDDSEYKKAKIYVNGHKTYMNTYDAEWTKNINNYVMEGSNGIKIEPDGTVLDVIGLKVEALERE